MKIGILVTIISGFGKKGFYHSQEIGLGKALRELGHEVIVYKGVSREKKRETIQAGEGLRVEYIPMPALGVHGIFDPRVLDQDLDGLLAFSDTQLFLPRVYRFCEKNGICLVPYIGIAHSSEKNFKSLWMDAVYRLGTRRIYRKIPVLAKNDGVRRELMAQGVRDCEIAPVGLDETELKQDFETQDRSALRAKYGYSDQDVIISFVGRMKSEKRPLDMLRILDQVKEKKPFRLLMVGEGYLEKEVMDEARRLSLTDRVRLIPRIPYEKMWEVHYIADYIVNLCDREIFGMALLEGIYYLSSAAATDAPGPRYILTGLPGHALCQTDGEIASWLTAPAPNMQTLRDSAAKMMERMSWRVCAQMTEQRTAAYHRRPEQTKGGAADA